MSLKPMVIVVIKLPWGSGEKWDEEDKLIPNESFPLPKLVTRSVLLLFRKDKVTALRY